MKRRTAFIIFAFTLALLLPAAEDAGASESADAMAPVHHFVDAFNKGDLTSAVAACADEAFVMDDFPPHAWQGKGCEKWADGFRDVAKKEGITDARMVLGKPRHVDVAGDWAYVVVPVTLILKHFGKPKELPSMFTAALHKETAGWRITGWAWADL